MIPIILADKLAARDFLIRDLSGSLPGCYRVNIGSPGENDAFIKGMKEVG